MTESILEIGKMLLTAYFSFMRLQGASSEKIEEVYSQTKKNFAENSPDKLPDV